MPRRRLTASGAGGRSGARERTWSLDASAFHGLLARLDPDPDQAAEQYEALRVRLIQLFEWRRCTQAEDLADQVLNRLAKRLEQGADVPPEKVRAYSFGIAYRLFLEELRRDKARHAAVREQQPLMADPEPTATLLRERRQCLEQCLRSLPEGRRDMVYRYYGAERKARREERRQLAEELGITDNNLWVRVHRCRRQIEECVNECLERRRPEAGG